MPATADTVSGILATDFDSDGRTDLVAACSTGRVSGLAQRHRNEPPPRATKPTFESWPMNAANWRQAQAIDLDLDGLPDLLGLPAAANKPGELLLPAWARNEGNSLRGADLVAQARRAPGSTG